MFAWWPIEYKCAPSMTSCVAFRTCAVAIRASSFVRLSSLFNASSISPVLPTSFFRYFSKQFSAGNDTIIQECLTRTALPNLLGSNTKNREHLHHNLYDYIRHFGCWSHLGVDFETSEEVFDALKDVDKSVLACMNVYSCLRGVLQQPAIILKKNTC